MEPRLPSSLAGEAGQRESPICGFCPFVWPRLVPLKQWFGHSRLLSATSAPGLAPGVFFNHTALAARPGAEVAETAQFVGAGNNAKFHQGPGRGALDQGGRAARAPRAYRTRVAAFFAVWPAEIEPLLTTAQGGGLRSRRSL